jgi:hypothetical protein
MRLHTSTTMTAACATMPIMLDKFARYTNPLLVLPIGTKVKTLQERRKVDAAYIHRAEADESTWSPRQTPHIHQYLKQDSTTNKG